MVDESQLWRGDNRTVEFGGKPVLKLRKMECQHRIFYVARVFAVAPHFHARWGIGHVLGQIANGTRPVLTQTRLAVDTNFLKYHTEACVRIVVKLVSNAAIAMKLGNVNVHTVPCTAGYRKT